MNRDKPLGDQTGPISPPTSLAPVAPPTITASSQSEYPVLAGFHSPAKTAVDQHRRRRCYMDKAPPPCATSLTEILRAEAHAHVVGLIKVPPCQGPLCAMGQPPRPQGAGARTAVTASSISIKHSFSWSYHPSTRVTRIKAMTKRLENTAWGPRTLPVMMCQLKRGGATARPMTLLCCVASL